MALVEPDVIFRRLAQIIGIRPIVYDGVMVVVASRIGGGPSDDGDVVVGGFERWPFEDLDALLRAESDRIYMQRLEAENRQPRPFTVYDPQGLQRPPYAPRRYPGINIRLDPNLPDSPPPSLERTYLYNGR